MHLMETQRNDIPLTSQIITKVVFFFFKERFALLLKLHEGHHKTKDLSI